MSRIFSSNESLPNWIKEALDTTTPIEFDGKKFHFSGRFKKDGKQIDRKKVFAPEIERLGGFFQMGGSKLLQADYFIIGIGVYDENEGKKCRDIIAHNNTQPNKIIPIIYQPRLEEFMDIEIIKRNGPS